MPSGFKTHRPPRPAGVADQRAREQTRARHANRALPFNGWRWQTIRRMVLDTEPLCRACGDIGIDVDHIDGDNANNTLANLQPLCRSCHSSKTRREQNEKKSRGTDPQGNAPPAVYTPPRIGAA